MALQRPPTVPCEGFAALGPQLQAVAQAADTVMCGMTSTAILSAMDGPAATFVHPGGLVVPGDGVTYAIPSYNATQEFNNNGTTGPIGIVGGTNGPYISALTQRAWFYVGVWMQTNASAAVGNRWKMRLRVQDTDPVTAATSYISYFRHWRNNFAGAVGGAENLHLGVLVPTGGGYIEVALKQDSGGNINTVTGRLWVARMSKKR